METPIQSLGGDNQTFMWSLSGAQALKGTRLPKKILGGGRKQVGYQVHPHLVRDVHGDGIGDLSSLFHDSILPEVYFIGRTGGI